MSARRLAGAGPAAALGAAVAAALGLAPPGLTAGLAVLAVLVMPVIVSLGLRAHEPGRRTLLAAFVAAITVRAVVGVTISYAAVAGFFALDDAYYGQVGMQMAQHWAGQGPPPPEIHGAVGYYHWNALLFFVLGPVPLAPILANAAFGGFAVLLAHGLARDIGGERAARTAAWLTALWPSLVLWSSLNLKDALAILSILLVLRGVQRLQARLTPAGVAAVLAGFAVLSQLRGYLVLVTGVAVALAALLPRLRAAPLGVGTLLLAAALLVPRLGPVEDLAVETQLATLDHTRAQMATGDSAYLEEADVSTPSAAARYLPVGLLYFLLAPAPWQLLSARQLLTLPEMLAWYALLPMVALGLVRGLRERFARALPLASYALLTTLSYALVEGNLGTAYRHRAQVLVALLVFAAVGLARLGAAPARAPGRAVPLALAPREASL